MISALKDAATEVKSLLEEGRVQLQDLDYPKYNGAEIIP
jgi:hypothetical protein